MVSRGVRLIAIALAVFFLAQQVPILAFAEDSGDQSCCCKDKSASCCRRSHHKTAGPGLSSRESCCGCVIWVRHSQPVAAIAVRVGTLAGFVAVRAAVAPVTRMASAQRDTALFQRPPPSLVL